MDSRYPACARMTVAMDSCFRRNDRNLHSIVILAEAGIHSYYPQLLRTYRICLKIQSGLF